MKKYHLFTIHPTYQLDMVLDTEAEAREKAAGWKRTYPDVPIYMEEIHAL